MCRTFFLRILISSISIFLLVTTCLFGQVPMQEVITEPVSSGPNTGLVIGGSALAGAIGGILATVCVDKNGKRGHRGKEGSRGRTGLNGNNGTNGAQGSAGPVGPVGPAGSFARDSTTNTISFELSTTVLNLDVIPNTINLFFFVTQPDGTSLVASPLGQTNPIILPGTTAQNFQNDPIVFTFVGPQFGTYTAGVMVAPVTSTISVNVPGDLNVFQVFANRGGGSTTFLNHEPETPLKIFAGMEVQFYGTFNYTPANVPFP